MWTLVHGPRRIDPTTHRVSVPKRVGALTGVEPGGWVTIGWAPGRAVTDDGGAAGHGELTVAPVDRAGTSLTVTDPARARRVLGTRQVTIPTAYLRDLGLEGSDAWVYFAVHIDASSGTKSLRVVPAAVIDLRVAPATSLEGKGKAS